jgi:hypothetical protein
MQQISQATVEVAVTAQCEMGSLDAAVGETPCAGAEVEALRNELAARDAAVADAAIRADTMMMRLHEAHAERAAADAALARMYSAAPQSLAEIAAMHPVPSREAAFEGAAGLGEAMAVLHTAQAEAAERDAGLVRARAEAAEQRAAASAARDEIETLRQQLADCRQALAGAGQPPVECEPTSATAARSNEAEPPSEAHVAERPRPPVDPEGGAGGNDADGSDGVIP